MADRDANGRFVKGNKCSKLDFNKEMAQHVASRELYWAIRQCTELSIKDLKALIQTKDFENESLFTYQAIKKAVAGDFKALQWLWEMAIGRPKQQVDFGDDMQPIKFEIVDAKN